MVNLETKETIEPDRMEIGKLVNVIVVEKLNRPGSEIHVGAVRALGQVLANQPAALEMVRKASKQL